MLFAQQHFDPRTTTLPFAAASSSAGHPVHIRDIIAGLDRRQNLAKWNPLTDANDPGEALDAFGFFICRDWIVIHV